jgi:hypothetical protein
MTVYGSALFVHVAFAILLVGGGVYTHLAMTSSHVPEAWTACARMCCGCTSW